MKIIMITQGSLGDIKPFQTLAKQLLKKGHKISVYAPSRYRVGFEQEGLTYYPVGHDFYPSTDQSNYKKNVMQLLLDSINEQFAAVLKNSEKVDLIIGNGLDYA